MKLKIAFFSVLGLLLTTLLLGTFLDLSLSTAVVKNTNDVFLHFVAGYGLVIPYSVFALIGGVLVRVTIDNKEQKLLHKTLLFVLAAIALLAGIYFAAHDNFTVNGLNKSGLLYDFLAYGNATIVCALTFFLGFKGGKGNENKKLWIALVVIAIAIIVSQLFGTVVLKSIFHRPRFRSLGNGLEFQPWYLPFDGYKDFITAEITKEEFKSFPSGHSSVAALMMLYAATIPLIFPKQLGKKLCGPLFVFGFLYYVFIALSRICVGAHFLSDVSFGGLLTIIFSIIALTIIDKRKLLES